MTHRRMFRLSLALAAGAAIAACSSETPEADGNVAAVVNETLIPVDGNVTEVPPSETPVNLVEPTPEPTVVPTPAAGFDNSRIDIQDGADAVGMTARVDRTKGDSGSTNANESAPAQ